MSRKESSIKFMPGMDDIGNSCPVRSKTMQFGPFFDLLLQWQSTCWAVVV